MSYVIEGQGALVNPDEKHQYRNKGDLPFKIICGVPKEFE
jgi:quercetin dioxygenase-like cupin family protein